MANLLPQDNYDSYLTAAIGDSDTTIYVNELPTKTSGYLVIYQTNGRTIKEKIKYAGTSSSPNRLTGCTRGLPFTDTAGVISDTGVAANQYDHPANVRIAMTDNIHYLGKVISQLNGDEATGGVMQNPASRTIDSARDLVDKEYADALTVSAISAFAVTQNGADPSLTINVGAGRFIKSDKTSAQFAGASAQAVTDNATNYVEINPATNTLSVNTSAFTTAYFPIAEVVASGGDITTITDRRPWLTMHDGTIDAIRTWATVQTFTQNTLQISADPDSANDPVRSSYLDAQLTAKIMLGAIAGTSGEAISVGQAVYLKASDSKYYKAVGTGDEATYAFAGVALTAAGGADTAFTFAPPGHVVTTSGLTAGAIYYISDTAGTLATTPGTRYARVARANSTTQLQILEPKFIRSGSFTYVYTDSSPLPAQTCGFRPANITFRAIAETIGAISVGESQNGTESAVGYSSTYAAEYDEVAWILRTSTGPTSTTGAAGALSSTGFTPTHSSSGNGGIYRVYWTARSF